MSTTASNHTITSNVQKFIEFVESEYPHLRDRFEIYSIVNEDPQSLVGRHVVAIRSGFSCGSEGGTRMTIVKVEPYNGGKYQVGMAARSNPREDGLGWSTPLDTLHNAVRFDDK